MQQGDYSRENDASEIFGQVGAISDSGKWLSEIEEAKSTKSDDEVDGFGQASEWYTDSDEDEAKADSYVSDIFEINSPLSEKSGQFQMDMDSAKPDEIELAKAWGYISMSEAMADADFVAQIAAMKQAAAITQKPKTADNRMNADISAQIQTVSDIREREADKAETRVNYLLPTESGVVVDARGIENLSGKRLLKAKAIFEVVKKLVENNQLITIDAIFSDSDLEIKRSTVGDYVSLSEKTDRPIKIYTPILKNG